ncbi:ChbG/HpnK family deacetylase [Oxalobacteraceae bacterium CAVE-383]|nr:ChbG/HpnK family deacetylase [Oxalobacteraceae bacterium CAVE-383]
MATSARAPIPIALCADDYAQNQAIDDGILHLLSERRLSAVSCFSNSPRWLQRSAPALREAAGDAAGAAAAAADIGLHFNLTEDFGAAAGAPYRLRGLILRSLFTRLDSKSLRQRLNAQLDAFEAGYGRPPAFIDGHQHVHQLPGVRQVLLQVLGARYGDVPVWVRNTVPASAAWRGKPLVLKLLGGAMTATALRGLGIPSNRGFAGVYGFDRADYAACFAEWLQAAAPGMLIMCHPAAAVGDGDEIAAQRPVEYHFLRSPEFLAMLEGAGVRLAPLSGMEMTD